MATLLDSLLSGFSMDGARAWLRQTFHSFDPSVELVVSLDKSSTNEKTYFSAVRSLGVIRTLTETADSQKNRPLAVIAVEMKENLTERTSRAIQFRLAKRLLECCARQAITGLTASITQGLFFFYAPDGSCYRFSLVSGEFSKRALKLNDAKRQSFFVDTEKANNVIRRRFTSKITTYQALQEAFSVESLTNEFYRRLFHWFCWAADETTNVTYPNDIDNEKDNRALLHEALIRLITRLMFVWFVCQKNLIPKKLFDKTQLASLLTSFDGASMEEDNYYRCVLQNLFFATLNCPPNKRKFQEIYRGMSNTRGIKTCYRYKKEFRNADAFKQMLEHVPFLNCSLFECLDKVTEDGKTQLYFDGFSDKSEHRAHVPNGLFFKEEHTYTLYDEKGKARQVPVCGLIHLFNLFDFTVDENLHNDADIVLDPELLGKVFENLLGICTDDGVTLKSETGSFYTPREIVSYMVETALREHIKRNVPIVTDEHLDKLFDESDDTVQLNLPASLREPILNALYNCKIFDPACGSGAFPMGVLQTMVRLLHRLDPYNIEQLKRIEAYYKENNAELETERDDKERADRAKLLQQQRDEGRTFPDYARKLYLIENCIYGSDIQPIAVQISKLRFFISLLCDQLKQNWDPQKENYGFLALPNLETKFVCANTLLHLPKLDAGELDLATGDIRELRIALQNNRKKIFYSRTTETKEKYRQKDKVIREAIQATIQANGTQPDEALIAQQMEILEALTEEYKKVKAPKYVEYSMQEETLFGPSDELPLKTRVDINEEKRNRLRQQITAIERKIESERKKGENKGSTALDEIAHQIASWNPYDQNATADFFDPLWMFNVEKGFDIVIGNPPYVQLQKLDNAIVDRYQSEGYKAYARTGDLYCLFYERGVELLKEKALLAYITSNKWMRAGYGEALRGYFADETNPLQLLDFAGTKIFPGATVDTNILIVTKEENEGQTQTLSFKDADKSVLSFLTAYVKQCHAINHFMTSEAWTILSPIEQSIKEKIENVGTPLKDWDIEINYGIKTGFTDAFVISTETRNAILANCQTTDERKRTEALIRPILRGRDIKRYGYDWADLWLINTHNGVKGVKPRIDIDDYPAVKKHLDYYWNKISKRSDKGDTPYNLRNCAYLEDFSKPKLCWTPVNSEYRFTILPPQIYFNNSLFMIVGKDLNYLCGCLNSSLYVFYLSLLLGGETYTYGSAETIKKIPVLKDAKYKDKIEALVSTMFSSPSVDITNEINHLIYQLYGLDEEEIDYIEHYGEAPSEEEPVVKNPPKPKKPQKPTPKMPDDAPVSDDDYLE